MPPFSYYEVDIQTLQDGVYFYANLDMVPSLKLRCMFLDVYAQSGLSGRMRTR